MPAEFSLVWLPSVLKAAGLKVATVDGWETRGAKGRDMGPIVGVICHHTAGARHGNMPSLNLIVKGRSDLAGPLSQLALGRDGTFYIVAAGRCNHAGDGVWHGAVHGNANFIGIEAENTGRADDSPWPEVQLDAYRRGVAAILKHLDLPFDACCGHREYALPSGRKPDPTFDMNDFRAAVDAFMRGAAAPRPPIPAVEPGGAKRPTLRRGSAGDFVAELQRRLDIPTGTAAGTFGPKTEAAVRQWQRDHGLVPDGIFGPRSWEILDRERPDA